MHDVMDPRKPRKLIQRKEYHYMYENSNPSKCLDPTQFNTLLILLLLLILIFYSFIRIYAERI